MYASTPNFDQLTLSQCKNLLIEQPRTISDVVESHIQGNSEPLKLLSTRIKKIKLIPTEWTTIITTALDTINKIAHAAATGHPQLLRALSPHLNNTSLSSTEWKTIITSVPETIGSISVAATYGHHQLLRALTPHLNNDFLSSTEWKTIITSDHRAIAKIASGASEGFPKLLRALTPHLNSDFLSSTEWKTIIIYEKATIGYIAAAAVKGHPALLESLAPHLNSDYLSSIEWKKIITARSETIMCISFAVLNDHPQLFQALSPHLNDAFLSSTEWEKIITASPHTLLHIKGTTKKGHPQLLQALASHLNQIELCDGDVQHLKDVDPAIWTQIITKNPALISAMAKGFTIGRTQMFKIIGPHLSHLNADNWYSILTRDPSSILSIAKLSQTHHLRLIEKLSSSLDNITFSSGEWQNIITESPSIIYSLVLLKEKKCPTSLLENLLSQVHVMELTDEQWQAIFTDSSATVSAILLSASSGNHNLLNVAIPHLSQSSAITWQNIIRHEPRVVAHLAYAVSHGHITQLEAHLPTIIENLSEDSWVSVLTTGDSLIQLSKAFENEHRDLFDAAKVHFGKLSPDNWGRLTHKNAKIIPKSISLAKKKDEPSLLNAITNYLQGQSPKDLSTTLSNIQDHIPKLARYAIERQHTELSQVLNQALQVPSIDLGLTDDDKQKIQTLASNPATPVSGTGLFAQRAPAEVPVLSNNNGLGVSDHR